MSFNSPSVQAAASSTWFIDVHYRGVSRLIACGLLETSAGLYLVDPGPAVSLDTLRTGLRAGGVTLADVRGVLLTHIHLDHAGATGDIVRLYPHITVYVHRRGARHLVRPERLLASARRIYGNRMDELWGSFLAVPQSNVRALDGGESLLLGRRKLQVAYTPGHASHHVCYLDEHSGVAFVGDTAGMRVMGTTYTVPVAPPPDIDVEAWHDSVGLVRRWEPNKLFVTHFGVHSDVSLHLDHFEERLDAWAAAVRASLDTEGSDAARAARFHDQEMAEVIHMLSPEDQQPYRHMGQPRESWYGLARYWRKVAHALNETVMAIWKQKVTCEQLNAGSTETMVGALGIRFTALGDDYIAATMPVDARTRQPAGLLHGGASVALAESLGSVGAWLCVDGTTETIVGIEVNANHIRGVRDGVVTGTARPIHIGRTTHVWGIDIRDNEQCLVATSRLTVAVLRLTKDG